MNVYNRTKLADLCKLQSGQYIVGAQYSIIHKYDIYSRFRNGNIGKGIHMALEDGHAECFAIYKDYSGSLYYYTSGPGEDSWVVNGGKSSTAQEFVSVRNRNGWEERKGTWARESTATDTHIYYKTVTNLEWETFVDTMYILSGENRPYGHTVNPLANGNHSYSIVRTNSGADRFDSCVSSTHYLLRLTGHESWLPNKGWFVPGFDSWLRWFQVQGSKIHSSIDSGWRYNIQPNSNVYPSVTPKTDEDRAEFRTEMTETFVTPVTTTAMYAYTVLKRRLGLT